MAFCGFCGAQVEEGASFCQACGGTRARWQYHVEHFSMTDRWSIQRQAEEMARFNQRLNDMGAEGWEMVSYESIPMAGAFTGSIKGYAYLLFFKRPRI